MRNCHLAHFASKLTKITSLKEIQKLKRYEYSIFEDFFIKAIGFYKTIGCLKSTNFRVMKYF